jgi:pimeloyl-ACP methyl ester carboxylesterase
MLRTPQRYKSPSGAAYAVQGEGEILVLVHGVGMRLEAWSPQIEALSARFKVIAVDLPGHGESPPLASDASLADFVAWFRAFIEELGLGPVSVAGHSMGALIAGGIAAEAPELVRRVALLNGVYKRDPTARSAVKARAVEITTGDFDREAPLNRWFGDGHEHEAAYELCKRLLADVDKQGYATAYRAFANGDAVYADRWPEIDCPALFLTGADDQNSTPEMCRAMAFAAPRGRAVIIDEHRHMVNLTAPDLVNTALSEWMETEPEGEQA